MPAKLPPGSTTAIGSLPHSDAAAAAAFALAACDVPAWPQLPKRDIREWMVPQYAADLPGFVIDEEKKRFHVERDAVSPEVLTAFYERALDPAAEFPLAVSHAAGFHAFVEGLEEAPEKPAFVKGQVTGPLTFILGLNLADGRPINTDEELRGCALMLLAKSAAWQAKVLGPHAREGVVIFMDEPIYSALGTAAYLSIKAEDLRSSVNEVAGAAREAGALVGIHCCGNADWETVLSTEIDILNFDAWGYFDTLAIYPDAVSAFLERGGVLAWGIVPTSEDINQVDEVSVMQKLDAGVDTLVGKGVDAGKLKRQSIITPSCGCGSLTVEQTEKVFRLLKAAGEHWRGKM